VRCEVINDMKIIITAKSKKTNIYMRTKFEKFFTIRSWTLRFYSNIRAYLKHAFSPNALSNGQTCNLSAMDSGLLSYWLLQYKCITDVLQKLKFLKSQNFLETCLFRNDSCFSFRKIKIIWDLWINYFRRIWI
jgi:hypothetical protein